MFTLTIFLVQRGMMAEMVKSAPPGMPNVFLLDITGKERDAVVQVIKEQRGIEGPPDVIGTVAAKLVSIDGVSIESKALKGWARRFLRARGVTSASEKPKYAEIVQGAWWNAKTPRPETVVAVSEEAAQILHVHPGSHMEWEAAGRRIQARVAAVHRIDSIRRLPAAG